MAITKNKAKKKINSPKPRATKSKKIQKLSFANNRKRLTLTTFVLLFACLGVYLLVTSFARNESYASHAANNDTAFIAPRIRACESGGKVWGQANYRAVSSSGSYRGAYQFSRDLWGNYKGYSTADQAPSNIQDERFAQVYNNGRGKSHWTADINSVNCWGYPNGTIRGAPAWGGAPSQTPTSGGGGSSYGCDNHPTIRQSSTGGSSCVKHLQDHLNKYGAGLVVDGAWGTRTTTAVKNFQSSKGLAADGVVGPNTWNALHAGTSTGTQTSTDGRIQGIKFGGGDNILSLEREGTGQRTFINSNSDGSYFFNNLSTPGTYIVRVNPQSGKSIRWTACGNRVGSCHDNPDAQGTGAEAKVYFGGPGYIDLWFHFN